MFQCRKFYPYIGLEFRIEEWLYSGHECSEHGDCCPEEREEMNYTFRGEGAVEMVAPDEMSFLQQLIDNYVSSTLGLPADMKSYFTPNFTSYTAQPVQRLNPVFFSNIFLK